MGEKKRSTSPRQFAATAITRRKLREGTGVTGGPRTLSAPAAAGEAHAPPPDEPSTITRPGTGRRGAAAMAQEIAPIAVRPSMLSGISEQSVVSHYEHIYGTAVRRLNAVRRELAALDAGVAPHVVRGLKGQEISLMGSVALHELYFGNLGGLPPRRTQLRPRSPRLA